MIIKKQRNIYYLDTLSNTYKGYIETYISNVDEMLIRYKFAALEITNVSVYKNGELFSEALFTIEFLKDKINDKNLFKNTNSNFLNIRLTEKEKDSEIKIKIDFTSTKENTSLIFYKPFSDEDKHREVVAINKNNDSSGIFPSIDSKQSYKWELIYIYSSFEELQVISPGVLKSFVEEDSLNISSYTVQSSVSGFINFALGTYKRNEIINGEDKKLIFYPLFLDNLKEAIMEVNDDFVNIFKYVEFFIQMPYPLDTLNIMFTLLEIDKINALNTAIYNIAHISTFNDIEPKFLIKRTIAEILCTQIFSYYVYPKDPTDFWIFCGFKGYLEDYCVRLLLGNNEFLFQYKKDKDFVVQNDVYELPLCHEKRDISSMASDFFIKKSKLIFHTLENNLSKAFLEKISHFLLEKKDQIGENFTGDFLSLIKDITGKDMKSFFEFYVFRPGLVKVNFKFTIDPKKNRVDFKITQEATSKMIKNNTKVLGNLTLMSYEVEGSFEHIVNFSNTGHFYYHIRTKKRKKVEEEEDEVMPLLWMRLDPKQEHLIDSSVEQPDYMFIEQALDKNVIGQIDALEELAKNPSIQICEVLERLLENSHVFYKIRIKVMYCLARINIEKFIGFQRLIQFFMKKYFVQSSTIVKPNEFMFVNYFLQKHCVRALSMTDPFIVRSHDERNVSSATVICSFIINILKFNDNSANNFNDSWYIASVIEDLSKPLLALQFQQTFNIPKLENTMKFEEPVKTERKIDFDFDEDSSDDLKEIFREEVDNNFEQEITSKNHLDTDKMKFINEALEEVERYRIMDMIFPSHKNIITESAIYLYGRLSIYGCLGMKKETLVDFTKYPNSYKVRKAAFIILVLLYNDDPEVIKYLLQVIETDNINIKLIILDAWINLLEIRTEHTKSELISYKSEILNLVNICEFDYDFKNKIFEIIDFLDNKDLTSSEYNQKIIEFSKLNYNTQFYIDKVNSGFLSNNLLTIKLKNFLEMKREYLKESYIIKLKKPKEQPEADINLEKKENPIINEIKFESQIQEKSSSKEEIKINENFEQKNTKLEDINLEEMLKFDELENKLSEKYNFKKVENFKDLNLSSNDFSSMNLTSKPEYFTKLVNYENDQYKFNDTKQTNSEINKLIDEFRNQVSENSRRSDSGSFTSAYNFLKPNFDDTFDEFKTTEDSPTNFTFEERKKIDIEKFLLDDSEEDTNYECKTQVLEERDFDNHFDKIDFISTKNNESTFRSYKDLSVTDMPNLDIFKTNSHLDTNFNRNISPIGSNFTSSSTNFATSSSSDQISHKSKNIFSVPTSSSGGIFSSQTNSSDKNIFEATNPIMNFLDSDENEFIKSISSSNSLRTSSPYRIDATILRFPVKTKIRLPISSRSHSGDSDKRKGKRRKFEEPSSPEFYSSKKTTYQIRPHDLSTKKLFYGTINNVSIKQVNKVIFKNKNNSFFDWRPKTFKEIEVYINNENKYKKICKEIERALVFALSYSQFGSRTFNITKRLFETFEAKVYETYVFPKYCHPMSEQLRNYCMDFLNKICLNERFLSFIRPVNIDGLEAYVDIVRYPMCLDIVQKKMMKYSTLESFYGDIRQIIKNCCYFNQNDSEIVQSARKLLKMTQEFDKFLSKLKTEIRSGEVIKLLLQRFEDSNNFMEIIKKFDGKLILTFKDLVNEVRNIKSTSMRKFISQQELINEIEIFEDHLFHAFNVYDGKVYCWDIYQ
ncbi:transcription initiation factor TFIID subunit 2 (TAF2) [Vairimorpha necatrix]|uniref:Transcription initiation factor TFIID subunit 2 (TAF2) n=1 Tax=Vairimorpha necatrix TaxID=6039 RepID=A0AAX4JA91_9MICR